MIKIKTLFKLLKGRLFETHHPIVLELRFGCNIGFDTSLLDL